MRTIVVCGSRGWTHNKAVYQRIHDIPDRVVIRHGGAPGPDRLAGRAGEMCGHQVEEFLADWKSYPRRAGIVRNLQMLDTKPIPDEVIAFWDGLSRGTGHMIAAAVARGIPVEVITE